MPAFSFKERFVPMVEDGSKPCTIRSFRRYPVRVGQMAHLFYGMRTAHCRRLRPAVEIKAVYTILMTEYGRVLIYDTNWIEPKDRDAMKAGVWQPKVNRLHLTGDRRHILAWADGFRHRRNPADINWCFEEMMKYWRAEGALPFVGFITVWGEDFIKNWMR